MISSSNCSGLCPIGWMCPVSSTAAKNFPCSRTAMVHCPMGSSHQLATSEGYYAISSFAAQGGGFGAQEMCPRGSFCLGGIRKLCPAGRFGRTPQETNTSCTGSCLPGYFCPAGSISEKQAPCGTHAVFCPAGSTSPTAVQRGHYTTGTYNKHIPYVIQNNTYEYLGGVDKSSYHFDSEVVVEVSGGSRAVVHATEQRICEAGYYCLLDGIRHPCPSGRYGSSEGMGSQDCSGPCPEGHFCVEGSVMPSECGNHTVFCPLGSATPLLVMAGYYSVPAGGDSKRRTSEKKCEPGHFCDQGIRKYCLPGTWGGTFGLISAHCDGPCEAGFFCPLGSQSPQEVMCGDATRYCPIGSHLPIAVAAGYYSTGGNESTRFGQTVSPMGHFASLGLLFVCPAGTYGASEGLTTALCSGRCLVPGYYCPARSTSPTMHVCGGDGFICPAPASAPLAVTAGFYTADYLQQSCPPGQYRDWSLSIDQSLRSSSPSSHSVIVTAELTPECQLCPEGTFKPISGDRSSECRMCDHRHSTYTADRLVCQCTTVTKSGFISHFDLHTGACATLSVDQVALLNDGEWATNISVTWSRQYECEPGYYAVSGRRHRCPAGRYGALPRQSNPQCAGPCAPGYFCSEASVSPFSVPCGQANLICPEGVATPIIVPPGFYSNEDLPEHLRTNQLICPPGYYCPGDGRRYDCPPGTYADQPGTFSPICLGQCDPGYYCIGRADSRRQFACGGVNVFCVTGSSAPQPVHGGFYGISTGPDAGKIALYDPANTTYSAELVCEPGYYCIAGVKFPCPPGRFGWRYGATSALCGGLCAPGHYCPSYLVKSEHPDAPPHTIWPGKPHLSAAEYKCGGNQFFCPAGSFFPRYVGGGNFTIGGDKDNATRSGQEICPPGTYCDADGIMQFCPKGRFGSSSGLMVQACTGWCPSGFFCLAGTSKPTPCEDNHYSESAAYVCSPCPGSAKRPGASSAIPPCKDSRLCCTRG